MGVIGLALLVGASTSAPVLGASKTTKKSKKKAAPVKTTAAPVTTSAVAAPPSSAAATTVPAGPVASGNDLESTKKFVADLLSSKLTFPQPKETLQRGTHNVAIISAGQSSPGPATVSAAIDEAVQTSMAWDTPPIYDGKFSPIEQASLISKAVANRVDVIFLVAITPSTVTAAVAEAVKAKIPVMCVLCGPDLPAGVTGIQADPVAAGNAQAAYVTAMTNGKGRIVLYKNKEYGFTEQQMNQAEKRLKEICPGCKVDVRSLLLAEARVPNAPIFTALLNDYPSGSLDYVIMPFDSPSGALANTASQLGRSDFGIVGYGALSPFVDMIGLGQPVVAKASVTISSPYYGWVAVDLAGRILSGKATYKADAMPVALITKDNFKRYPAGFPYVGPPFDYKQFFSALWKK